MGDDRSPETARDDTDGDRKRLDELEVHLRAARKGSERPAGGSPQQRDAGIAYRVLVEMIAGLGFGAVAGWWLDSWLGTTPILLVTMILLGFAGSLLNAYRAIQRYTERAADRDRE